MFSAKGDTSAKPCTAMLLVRHQEFEVMDRAWVFGDEKCGKEAAITTSTVL